MATGDTEMKDSKPEADQTGPKVGKSLSELGATLLFEKVLTTSDANGQGRIVVPKVHAEAHLPSLDFQNGIEVPAEDTAGDPHTFKFRYWINNSSRMYLLEGTQKIQNKFSTKIGDVLTFARGQDGKLLVSGRAGTKADHARRNQTSGAAKGNSAGIEKVRGRPRGKSVRTRLAPDGYYFAPLKDGVFRAVPEGLSQDPSKVIVQNGHWTVILNCAGELYQAFFESQEAALEAFNASGSTQ